MSVAAHKGREEIVKMLISADADVNIDSNNGSTPLIQASHFGRFADSSWRSAVDVLFCVGLDTRWCCFISFVSNVAKRWLHTCSHCCAGHAEVVKLLVKANALVDKANQKGTTALMRATQEGNEEVVGILVSAGADVSKRNNERMNALMLGSQVRVMVASPGIECSYPHGQTLAA